MILAWTTAAFVRAKKMPDIKALLAQRRRSVNQQTRLEQEAAFHTIAARLGKAPKRTRLIHKALHA